MKQNLNCSGSTRVDGGEYGEVRVSASLRVAVRHPAVLRLRKDRGRAFLCR